MYPKAKCSLDYTTPFELLMATILAAQSTDVRVNIVTKSLFRKYPGPAAFAAASQVEMERDVKQTGFFRNKAKAVIACSKAIMERHGGEVPRTMEAAVPAAGVAASSPPLNRRRRGRLRASRRDAGAPRLRRIVRPHFRPWPTPRQAPDGLRAPNQQPVLRDRVVPVVRARRREA